MQTVIEFGDFHKHALTLLGEDGYVELINYVAKNPEEGEIIPGTGGFRKMRYGRPGMGKRGGVRVVYFFYTSGKPISLVYIYAKAKTENLTKKQATALYELAQIIKKGS